MVITQPFFFFICALKSDLKGLLGRAGAGFIPRLGSLSVVFNRRRSRCGASLEPLRQDSAESARRATYFISGAPIGRSSLSMFMLIAVRKRPRRGPCFQRSVAVMPFLFLQASFSLLRLLLFVRPQRELSVARATEV